MPKLQIDWIECLIAARLQSYPVLLNWTGLKQFVKHGSVAA